MARDAVLFIDANQYLKLYGMVAGKKLLDWLEEQQAHIFVSAQIVDEVLRNKLHSAQIFFLDKLKLDVAVPDHLLGVSDEKTNELRKNIGNAADELTALADDVLRKISRSEDDVSQRLNRLFDKAISPNTNQMGRARDRKERGNPPGKQKDTLGDQITWEQLLAHCKGMKQLWIITDDGDYGLLIEFAFDTPIGHGLGRKTACTAYLGLSYVAETWQLAAEAPLKILCEGGA
jgi:PIN domain